MPSGRTAPSRWRTCSSRTRCRHSVAPASTRKRSRTRSLPAFRLRDRLPERERYNVEGAYYVTAATRPAEGNPALRRAVELDSTNYDAVNSLAVALGDSRDGAGADSMFRLALEGQPDNGTILGNLATQHTVDGQFAAFDSVLATMRSRSPSYPTGTLRFGEYWARRDYDAAEKMARADADTAEPRDALSAQGALARLALVRGRLHEAERHQAQVTEGRARLLGDTISPYENAYFHATVDGSLRSNVHHGLATLDSTLRAVPPTSVPLPRDRSLWLSVGYAQLGDTAKARSVASQFEARLDTAGRRRQWVFLARVHGLIDVAEGKTDSAVAQFRRGDIEADGLPTYNCTACTPVFIAQAYDGGSQPDSARKYLTQYVEMAGTGHEFIDRYYLAPALFRLGELYESAGDPEACHRVLRPLCGPLEERGRRVAATRRRGAEAHRPPESGKELIQSSLVLRGALPRRIGGITEHVHAGTMAAIARVAHAT